MAEGKGVFFLVWVKSGMDPDDSCQLHCHCVLLKYFWLRASSAPSTFSILNSWAFPSSLIFLWNNLSLI